MPTILIVDDVETDRRLMGKTVADLGHRPEYAQSGDEAVAKATAVKPALILLDIVMPGQDGFATCRALKKDPATAAIPIVVVSGKGTEADRFWAQKQGSNGYVVKPFTPEQLAEAIRKFL
jgi:CheY-like chemotaxis protein